MQTFLTCRNFSVNARRLDSRRLGKQRVECLQILKALRGESKGWRHHPATLMWQGHEKALCMYMNSCIQEWMARGFRNNIPLAPQGRLAPGYYPSWYGDDELFHKVAASHRSNLLRKDPDYYGKMGWEEEPGLPYFWPVTKEDVALKKVLEFCP